MIVLKSLNIHSINPAWFDNIPNLKGLSLYNNNLTSLSEDAFANLGNLSILSIDTNPIGDNIAPETFSKLPNLQQLYIGGIGMTKLNTDWFKSLSNLEELNTYNNLLDSIPEGIFDNLTRMKYLHLGGNRLTESRIPGNVFDNLSQLSELIVEVNNIENLNPEWFQNLHQLSVLSLNDNNIGNLPNGIFAPINNLRQLKMDQNNLKTINRDAFGNIQNLETASFEQNQINAIDERFWREAGPLYSFHLDNNICISDRFYSFGNNRNLTAFNICTRNFELIFETTTERGHPYKFFQVPSTTGINLRVKTDQEVHISLTSFNFLWNPSIEIIIGTGNNTLSTVIRNQNTRVVVVQSPKIIRLGQWTGLRITWVNNIILVTREGQEYPFLAYSMEDIFPIQFYGLQSPESQADWSILPIYVETIPTDDV
ncbi:unnamed protein product [Chironomus riparius]|uniref:Farnesoic acid O-methyl transferase domain-containing protein n=1 Tax=Chironomus riparius TaxID=315576 RepID=A0A9P0NG08_9DIPT|nr:unnamed protein product [Chironomus riparius]